MNTCASSGKGGGGYTHSRSDSAVVLVNVLQVSSLQEGDGNAPVLGHLTQGMKIADARQKALHQVHGRETEEPAVDGWRGGGRGGEEGANK